MYLTYEEYVSMGGKLESTAFTALSMKAQVLINYHTFGRAKALASVPDEVKYCIYELIESGLEDTFVTSTSNDGVNESYSQINSSADIIHQYLSTLTLDGVPLLYCGVT